MNASCVFGFVLVTICISGVSSGICFLDQMLTSAGECVDCPFCPGGQGMDLEQKVLRNGDGDPLECRGCELCGHGHYNDPKDHQYACIPCPAPCFKKNRKEYIPCGGSTIGLCGACINSEFEDRENNLDSPCTGKNESRSISSTQFEYLTDGSRPSPAEPKRTKGTHNVHRNRPGGLSIEWISFMITLLLLAGIVVACMINFRRRIVERCCNRDPELAKEVSSKATMISSACTTSSSLIDSTYNVKSNLSSDTDLEEDAPMLPEGGDQARQELSLSGGMPSSGPECLHVAIYTRQRQRCPTLLLTANDKYIVYTSKHIFGEGKINAMCREMGLSEQVIYSEHDRYVRDKQLYNDMVIHYLQRWIEKAGRNATFDVLCKSLDKHGFPNVSDKLLKMYHEHDELG